MDRTPTHRCKICGALWIFFSKTDSWPEASWSLYSPSCGQCCDNAPMGDQIVDLNIEAFDRANCII